MKELLLRKLGKAQNVVNATRFVLGDIVEIMLNVTNLHIPLVAMNISWLS